MEIAQRLKNYEREIKPFYLKSKIGTYVASVGSIALFSGIAMNPSNLEKIVTVVGASLLVIGLPLIYSNIEKINQMDKKYFNI